MLVVVSMPVPVPVLALICVMAGGDLEEVLSLGVLDVLRQRRGLGKVHRLAANRNRALAACERVVGATEKRNWASLER